MSNALTALIGQQYAFAYGRSGVLQQMLLDRSDIDRLLGAPDVLMAEKILTELHITDVIDQSLRDHESILRACGAWVAAEVARMVPASERDVFNILWMEGDGPLIAYLIKKHRGLTSAISREPAHPIRAFGRDELIALIEHDVDGDLPETLAENIRDIRDDETLSPAQIDARAAQAIATEKLRLAKKSGSAAIKRFIRRDIDMQNIRTALRMQETDDVRDQLLSGGTIPPAALKGDRKRVAHAARMHEYYALADLLDNAQTEGNALERAFRDVTAEDISPMWNKPLQIEPVFAFAETALMQLRILRVIFIGKRNDLSPQHIKRSLPPFLSASHYA